MANLALTVARAGLQALAASAIRSAFAEDVEGPRVPALHVLSSTDGAGMPIVFGRARLAGQLIWAARFTETATSSSAGGKGGPSVTSYSYAASFAVGLCEGEIDGIGRVWANGALFDLSSATYRVYTGTEDQDRDPLIEAVEGVGDPPAFRGTAYVVFEDLPLDQFGGRIPLLSFEVFRAPKTNGSETRLEALVRGVTMIPSSGEFAYATTPVAADLGYGRERSENALNSRGKANIEAALDDLQTHLPGCQSVLLVVAWFGTDLRCASCEIRPGVETAEKITRPRSWSVGGIDRASAYVVSETDDRPTYGGTPDDAGVIEAIAAIKARGLSVGLYPFILMDVPPGNALTDPYGGAEQAAFPWRGRITCSPASGEPGSPDKTSVAGDQVRAFFGDCAPGDFATGSGEVIYDGPAEWSFRRFVLHYAHLAALAGGVDAFLIGSEMRGLTQVRESASAYPAVAELKALAGDVRSVLGPSAKLSYAADWSEYFGHQPQDGSDDVYFNLDPLWTDDAIDFVGVDWYVPLADWRDGESHADAAIAASPYDLDYLSGNVEGGEGYDWYYVDQAARDGQDRTTITDGSGKPWVFRYKDIRSWWSNSHYDRPGGVEVGAPTAWTPQSKPIAFVEIGCPAVDKGANQPNVFVDPKSSESALPYYSTGARDDLIQRRYIEASLDYWSVATGNNPTSSVYGKPMLDLDLSHIWTWDARPFPDFPAREEIWADGANWRLGHWLTGRVGFAPLPAVFEELASRTGEPADVSALDGLVSGYVIDRPMTARRAFEPLARVYGIRPVDRAGDLAFVPERGAALGAVNLDLAVLDDEDRRIVYATEDPEARPLEARLAFVDERRDYQVAAVSARQLDATTAPVIALSAPVTLDSTAASDVVRRWLADAETGALSASLRLPPSALAWEVGDVLAVGGANFLIEQIDEGAWREVSLRAASARFDVAARGGEAGGASDPVAPLAAPLGVVLDLPLIRGSTEREGPRVAAAADPWPGEVVVAAGGDISGLTERARLDLPCAVGELLWDLYPGPVGRWDEGNRVRIKLIGPPASSASALDVLNGANALAVEGAGGEWEIIQFRNAELVDVDTYEISGLLRTLAGTEPGQGAPTLAGARIVALAGNTAPARLEAHERGAALEWRFAPAGVAFTHAAAGAVAATVIGRHDRPLRPVHLKVERSASTVRFSWTRRTRIGGDDWSGVDVPLGEDAESYLFELLDAGEPVFSETVNTPECEITTSEESALFPGAPLYAFEVRVTQLSSTFGAGVPRRETVYV
ncbi:MAG: glycoside hydrolase/phage tail family protein [Maricaulaceae bacterium]|jgi:hypothetical protein